MSAKLSKKEVKHYLKQLKPDEHLYEVTVTIRFASKHDDLVKAIKSVTDVTDTIHKDRRAPGYIEARKLDELDTM